MAGDTFNIDPKNVEAASAYAKRLSESTGQAKDYAKELDTVMGSVEKSYAEIEKSARAIGLDPKILADIRNIEKSIIGSGQQLRAIVTQGKSVVVQDQRRNKELAVQRKTLSEIRSLSKQLAGEAQRQHLLREASEKKQAEAEKEQEKRKREELRRNTLINKQGAEVANFMAKTAGVGQAISFSTKGLEVSLAGVLAMILEIFNKGNKMGGYVRQAAVQFSNVRTQSTYTAKAVSTASQAAWDLRNRFAMGAEESGMMVAHLTKAGIEERDMGKNLIVRGRETKEYMSLASRLVGVQHATQRSVDEQLKNIMELRNNFGMLVSSAQTVDALIADIGSRIPGLSPEQAVQDIASMNMGMRSFNSNVLDSITLYHSLNRDAEDYRQKVAEAREHAEKTGQAFKAPAITSPYGGIVAAPQEMQRGFTSWLSNLGKNLSEGMQIEVGRQAGGAGGSTPGDYFMNFQRLLEKEGGRIEVFEAIMENVMQKSAGLSGNLGERIMSMSIYLNRQYGLDIETARLTAKDIATGKYSGTQMEELKKKYAEDLEAMKGEAKTREQLTQKLVKTGEKIALSLKTVEERMKEWIERSLTAPIQNLATEIRGLGSSFAEFGQVLARIFSFGTAQEEAKTFGSTHFTGRNRQIFAALEGQAKRQATEKVDERMPLTTVDYLTAGLPGGSLRLAGKLMARRSLQKEQEETHFGDLKTAKKTLEFAQRNIFALKTEFLAPEVDAFIKAVESLVQVMERDDQKKSGGKGANIRARAQALHDKVRIPATGSGASQRSTDSVPDAIKPQPREPREML